MQGHNVQVAVDGQAQIIIVAEVTQQQVDRQQLAPMAQAARTGLQQMPQNTLADAGHKGKLNTSVRCDNALVQSMRAKLRTAPGRALYARQSIVRQSAA